MKILLYAYFFFCVSNDVFGQNLVPNPGFEEYFNCPQSINTNKANTKIAPHWNSPSYGTPDLYNTCSAYKMGIQNVTGVTNPFKGKGFAGIMTWEARKSFREYLQVQLLETLKANHTYIVSYRYKLSTYSKYAVDRIGFSLTDSLFFYKQDTAITTPATFSKVKPKALDQNTRIWETLETEYIAKGGEQYLIIGNFYNNSDTKATHLPFASSQEPMLEHGSYYYIDEVSVAEKILIIDSVRPLQDANPALLNNKIVNLSERYVLNNVLYDHDSHKLLPTSYDELNETIAILNKHPDWKIRISGHTDNVGSAEYNLTLSEKRTQSVKTYLISHGISEERIQAKGFGKSKPIVLGSDEKSRKLNRRVEVQFYQ